MVRTVNEYVNLDQIRATVVATVEGREVRVGDLAEVRRSHRDREILTRTDGAESVQLDVYKEADANMVALADRVRARVGEAGPRTGTGQGARRDGGAAPEPAAAADGRWRAAAAGVVPRLAERHSRPISTVRREPC